MRTVFKYILEPGADEIALPRLYRALSVGEQRGKICLWVEVDPDPLLGTRDIPYYVVPTGGRVPESPTKFIGTVLMHDASLVLHVYLGV